MTTSSPPRRDPWLVFCFKVTITEANLDAATGLFKSVSGLEIESEVVDFKEGGENERTHKLVGGTKFKNIVLKRGFSGKEFTDWRKNWEKSKQRVSGTIEQLDTKGGTMAKWEFTGGWPCKWSMSEFDASKNEVSIETIEIAHQGITRVS